MSPGFDPDDLVGEELSGIRLDEVLGGGRAGYVFRGTDSSTGEEVAVRVLRPPSSGDPDAVLRLDREFRSTKRLDHPNLVRNLRIEISSEFALMVMELVHGPDLGSVLSRQALSMARSVSIAAQLTRVVGYLHENGFLHRDIKPSNVFVAEGDRVRLGDLELLKSLLPSPESMLTRSGAVIGSPAYLAPEVITEGLELSVATDAYALGATLYHLFAGRPPHSGRTAVEVLRNAIQGPPAPIHSVNPAIPEGLAEVVRSLMALDPSGRPGPGEVLARRVESGIST